MCSKQHLSPKTINLSAWIPEIASFSFDQLIYLLIFSKQKKISKLSRNFRLRKKSGKEKGFLLVLPEIGQDEYDAIWDIQSFIVWPEMVYSVALLEGRTARFINSLSHTRRMGCRLL